MGSTLPYCDVVVTDKAMASHIQRTGLSDRLETVVLARLSELGQHLKREKSPVLAERTR
jgi:hypothetical protein